MLIGGRVPQAKKRTLEHQSEAYIFNRSVSDWMMTDPMNFPIRKFHAGQLHL
jgi:hypothetical protein